MIVVSNTIKKRRWNGRKVIRARYLREVEGLSYRAIAKRLKCDVKQAWLWCNYKML